MFNIGTTLRYVYATGVRIVAVKGDQVRLMDSNKHSIVTYCSLLENHAVVDTSSSNKCDFSACIDRMARECKQYLSNELRISKATLIDLRAVALAYLTGNFTQVCNTKLYNNYSGEYCRSLEYMNKIRSEGKIRR